MKKNMNERSKVLSVLGSVVDSILEAQFVISEVEEDSMSCDKFDEAYTYLQEALGLVEETKNIIICNMKGE